MYQIVIGNVDLLDLIYFLTDTACGSYSQFCGEIANAAVSYNWHVAYSIASFQIHVKSLQVILG
jgi:hypothetical protein